MMWYTYNPPIPAEIKGERVRLFVLQVLKWSVCNVGNTRINNPIFDGLYQSFIVIWGMVIIVLTTLSHFISVFKW